MNILYRKQLPNTAVVRAIYGARGIRRISRGISRRISRFLNFGPFRANNLRKTYKIVGFGPVLAQEPLLGVKLLQNCQG